jgi:hypothetical protein
MRFETEPVTIQLENHSEKLVMNVINIKYNIILGLSWLVRHNPEIDWKERTLTFLNCECRSKKEQIAFIKAVWIKPDG